MLKDIIAKSQETAPKIKNKKTLMTAGMLSCHLAVHKSCKQV